MLHALLSLLAVALLLPPYMATAIDMSQLQASLRKLGGSAQTFTDWQSLLQDSNNLKAPDKLRRVNEFFNRRVTFSTDMVVWHQSDYWATPMETLSKGAGDCEDFAIAKYFTLLNLGIPVEQLRLIYVKARIGGPTSNVQQAHMVLAYYASPDAEPLVLDSLITDIRPASRRADLQPVFSFNSQGVFNGVDAKATLGTGGVTQLSRWSDLLRRAHDEGFD
jgi:predicted transglutaminase-like cysteine proteinase